MPRGGKRPGAGRKKRKLDGVTKEFAANVLARISELGIKGVKTPEDYALALLKSGDERIRRDTFVDLINRRDGKPKESLDADVNLKIDATRRDHIRELITRLARKSQQ